MSLSWSDISLVFSRRRFSRVFISMAWSLIRRAVQPAPLHGRGVLRAELLVPGRQLRVAPPQLLLVVRLQLVPRPRQLQLVPLQQVPLLLQLDTPEEEQLPSQFSRQQTLLNYCTLYSISVHYLIDLQLQPVHAWAPGLINDVITRRFVVVT